MIHILAVKIIWGHRKNLLYRKTQKIVFPVEEGVENIE